MKREIIILIDYFLTAILSYLVIYIYRYFTRNKFNKKIINEKIKLDKKMEKRRNKNVYTIK